MNNMNCSCFKLVANGIVLPEIYFRYDQACQARQKLKDDNIAIGVNIINVQKKTTKIKIGGF